MKTKITYQTFNLLNRKKKDPNKFIFTGENTEDKTNMQLFRYNQDTCTEETGITQTVPDIDINSNDQYWLNIYYLNDREKIVAICKKLNIHNLIIQDILDVNQRPKYQEFENYAFLTIKSILPADHEVITEQISFIIGKNYLLSFQEKKADYFEHLRFRIRENSGIIRSRGADYLLFTLLESILDNYFITIQQLENDISTLDFVNMRTDPPPASLEKIEQYKCHVHTIKKAIYPIRDFTLGIERKEIQHIEKRHYKYFYEIKDLCLTLIDHCDAIDTSLESITNLYFSIQGYRMNQVMKTLTIVATIFIPLTFIAGIYGMNFHYMPELEWQYGYAMVWGTFILIFVGMVFYLKKKKWF